MRRAFGLNAVRGVGLVRPGLAGDGASDGAGGEGEPTGFELLGGGSFHGNGGEDRGAQKHHGEKPPREGATESSQGQRQTGNADRDDDIAGVGTGVNFEGEGRRSRSRES